MVLAVDFESMAPSPIVVAVLAVAVAACAGVAYADNAEQCAGCTFLSSGVCQHLTDGTCWEYVWMCLRAAWRLAWWWAVWLHRNITAHPP